MMIRRALRLLVVVLLSIQTAWAMTPEERKEYRDKLLQTLPEVPPGSGGGQSFSQWATSGNVLPPDFDALPKVNGLPDPFLFFDGKRTVKTPQDWQARRAEIKELFEKYMVGTIPPKPKIDQIVEIDPAVAAAEAAAAAAARGRGRGGRGPRGGAATTPAEGQAAGGPATAPAGRGRGGRGFGGRGPTSAPGSITRVVDLKYGPQSQITTRVTLVIPPGNGPFPVFIGGGPDVTNRGYISCSFNMSVDPPFAPDIGRHYPDYDFGTMGQVAFSTQVVVDYLYTLPQVDKPHIALTGYSRGGKMALITAAFEDRITAVIAGSTGVGGALPWRLGGERNISESIESTTRAYSAWFATKFRFFSGREDRLPVDGNLLVDLVAPRSVIMLWGLNDEVNSTWGNEATYFDALKLFKFLGKPDNVSMLRIDGPGQHHGANDTEATARWLDIQFGKSNEKWENSKPLFPWDFAKWKQASGESVDVNGYPAHSANEPLQVGAEKDWNRKSDSILAAARSMLGTTPSASELAKNPVTNPGEDENIDDTPRWVAGRANVIEHGWTATGQTKGITTKSIHFGPGKIRGDFYYKEETPEGKKLPTVIFLHGFSYPLGYMWVYRNDPHPILAMAHAGYAVLAYDQTGFGSRMNESATFYEKYPKWSQIGRMVQDVQDAVAEAAKDPLVDPDKIYIFGYGIGGAVGLHAAALEQKVKGVVSICGFTPMRTDTSDKGTGGIARFYEERPFMPKLGFFAGQEARISYDYQELIATISPRPAYVYSPIYNRDATPADVRHAVDEARKAYNLNGASGKLVLDEPWDYFRLSIEAQNRIVEWMTKNMQ